MRDNRSGMKLWVLGLVAILLLSLPLAAAAQTTGGSATTSTAAAATTNGISSPSEGAALSGTVEVRGYASSPNFMKWQLDLLPSGDPNAAIFLAMGETEGAFTYSFDTSKLPAGEHSLRLRVVRQDSNYDEYFTKFTIGQAAGTQGTTSTSAGAGGTTGGTPAAGAATPRGTATTSAAATGVGVTTNGLAAPREGQAISGDFVVRGYANDPNFMKWQLDLLPEGNSNSAVFLALGETPGVFTYTLSTANLPAGQHALRLRVVRSDSNYTEYTTTFTVGQAAAGTGSTTASGAATTGTATAAAAATTGTTTTTGTGAAAATTGGGTSGGAAGGQQTNGITAPADGATVSGTVAVRGYANNPSFMKWQLDLLPNGEPAQAIFLAVGEEAGEFTYSLNTTGLPAGEHTLRLRVVRADSNYDEYLSRFKIQ